MLQAFQDRTWLIELSLSTKKLVDRRLVLHRATFSLIGSVTCSEAAVCTQTNVSLRKGLTAAATGFAGVGTNTVRPWRAAQRGSTRR
jgi:hypothetical protein